MVGGTEACWRGEKLDLKRWVVVEGGGRISSLKGMVIVSDGGVYFMACWEKDSETARDQNRLRLFGIHYQN